MEEIMNISGPAAFTFVSVFIAVLGFIYKVWGDVYQNKKKQVKTEFNGTKVDELDGRVQMLERQVKDIPKKFAELVDTMKHDDERIHSKIDEKMDELKSMIQENKSIHSNNYNKLENRIYELMRNNKNGNNK